MLWELELKLVILTFIYLIGWMIFEKIFELVYDRYFTKSDLLNIQIKNNKIQNKISPIAEVTPLDQTWRYIKALKSPDWKVRRIACIQLGEKRGSAVVEALIEALNDPKEEVSIAAGEALAKIGDQRAIQALTEHIRKLEQVTSESYRRLKAA